VDVTGLVLIAIGALGVLWNLYWLIEEYKPPRGPPRPIILPEIKHVRSRTAPAEDRSLYVPDDRPVLIRRLDRSPNLGSTVAGQSHDEAPMVARKKAEGN
jgi:hypothetical protein